MPNPRRHVRPQIPKIAVNTGYSSIAVLFGLNYPNTSSELRGCANDIIDMGNYIRGKYDKIYQYTDIDPSTSDKCTRNGILGTLKEMAALANQDSLKRLFIHYSGHGSYIRDQNRDEPDGCDESIVPTDYMRHSLITDDEIHAILATFPATCTITMIFDCCHAGTIADLQYSRTSYKAPIVKSDIGNISAKCICMSGCLDSQTSADAYGLSQQRRFSGALTTCLLSVINSKNLTKVDDIQKEVQLMLRSKDFSQVPEVTASFDFTNENLFL